MYPLRSYRLISITGPDAEKFMQGQFTCDMALITEKHSSLGACCNNKGRMIAQFRLVRVESQSFLLRCPEDIADALLQHLSKYKVFYKCEMTPLDDYGVLGICGDEDIISQLFGQTPTEVNATARSKQMTMIRVPGDQPRFEIFASSEAISQQFPSLLANSCLADETEWQLQDIRAGVGEVFPTTQEEFIPQMMNLQSLGGISFKKGCYTGQEIVARMQYLGKLKKRMYLLAIDNAQGDIGTNITGDNDRVIGSIVRVATNTSDQQLALAVLDNASVDAGSPLKLENQPDSHCHVHELPYEVEQSGSARPSR
ncbi:hypothetical protein BTA51_25005 [Hahella sp. CCB-MM4]|nr:hypothetical protein BTA51_25005 [Hahella sp. CCB-MM4]